MKKYLLFTTLFLLTITFSYSQFEVRDYNTNELITDGQELVFTESGCDYADPCNWKFKVTNTSASEISMRIVVDEMVNNDGSAFQLCFAGVCLNSISQGSAYPNNAATIAAGATNSAGNNFWNLFPSDTNTDMSWTFRFQAYDDEDRAVGTPISVTYSYQPSLSVEDNKLNKIEIFPTITNNNITINTEENLSIVVYNLLGQKVKALQIETGNTTVDVSDLASQPYLVRLTNDENQSVVKKIIVK